MKRTILLLSLLSAFGITSAQQTVTTYSVYDTNQSKTIEVDDVTTVVEQVKNSVAASSTQQYVTAEDLATMYNQILSKLSTLESNIAVIKEKLGIEDNNDGDEEYQRYSGHEYVDLGLSVIWSTCNVGAENPEEVGDYFAWGETTPYYQYGQAEDNPVQNWNENKEKGYDWASYCYCNGTKETINKYNSTDGKTVLDLADDAARANWLGEWRMPTREELFELSQRCTWEWTQENGVDGYKVTGPNNNSIFFPVTGYRFKTGLGGKTSHGGFWSRSLKDDAIENGYYLSISENGYTVTNGSRSYGRTVRPVVDFKK